MKTSSVARSFETIVDSALPPGWTAELVLMLRGPNGRLVELGRNEIEAVVGEQGLVNLIKRRIAEMEDWLR